MSQENLSPFFGIVIFRRERYKTKEAVRPDVEAPHQYPCPTACASYWRQPSLFGDNTRGSNTAKLGVGARTSH